MKNQAEKLYTIRNGQLIEVTPEPIKQPEPVKQSDSKKLYTVQETMKIIGCGRSKLMQLLYEGKIKSIRLGVKWMIPSWAIDDFINAGR